MPPGKEMSVGHPGLGQEQVGIDRTQANGCRELLDRRIDIAEINLCPARPKARYYQIGIERHGPSRKSGPVLRLFEHVGIHLSCVRKHQRIILVELHRSFGQLPAFNPFLCRVLDPSESFPLTEKVGCMSVGDGKSRIERDGKFNGSPFAAGFWRGAVPGRNRRSRSGRHSAGSPAPHRTRCARSRWR